MNLNELNTIEENIFTDIKDRFQQGGYQTRVQNIFVKDFVQDALTSLNNGIKGGLISIPTATTTTPPVTPPVTPTTATTTAPAAPPVQKMSPSQLAAAKSQNVIAPGTATGTGPTPRLTPRDRLMLQRQAKAVKESAYEKMNHIFESIINIDEADAQMDISQYMTNWFAKYMQGVEWEGSKQIVDQKLNKLQTEYPKNVKQNLTDLARIGLALSKAGSPAGAPPEFVQMQKQTATDGKSAAQGFTQIKSELDILAKSYPDLYNKFIKTLRPVTIPTTAAPGAGLAEEKKR